MKKIRTLMLTALALIMGAMTAFASPENPTNEEVMTALTRATTVFEWFEHNPLPTDGKERFDSGYMLYYSASAAIRCIARLITNFLWHLPPKKQTLSRVHRPTA